MASANQTIRYTSPIRRLDTARREQVVILLFLIVAVILLFGDARVPPIALPDEARNAVNAIEMYIRGYSLVTTFNFQPDLWNTKPPLLIWLMTASITIFGPSELAIRLPSALAAMGILCCTLFFVRRVTGSLSTAVVAATLVLLSPGFFGEHGARAGDFDALLTFFVTAGLQSIFFAVHRARPDVRSMLAIGGLIAAGALTKSIAAFIPLTGVVLYLLFVGRLGRVLSRSHRWAIAGTVALAPLLIFYALREAAAPGYVSAVMYNDIAGRFSEPMIEATSPIFYLKELLEGWFVAGPFLVAAPLALAHCSARERLLFIYSASIALVSLLVYTAASNRAVQYALPMFPWLSIVAALTLRYLVRSVASAWRSGKLGYAIILGGALIMVGGQLIFLAASWRYERFPARQYYPQSTYGTLFAELSAKGITKVMVVDPGVPLLGKPGYAPLLRWHQLIWERNGLKIDRSLDQSGAIKGLLASCEPHVFNRWNAAQRIGSCAVVSRPLQQEHRQGRESARKG